MATKVKSVPYADELVAFAVANPEVFGLAPGCSERQVLAAVAELGYREGRRIKRELERELAYSAHADDAERRESMNELLDMALGSGLV